MHFVLMHHTKKLTNQHCSQCIQVFILENVYSSSMVTKPLCWLGYIEPKRNYKTNQCEIKVPLVSLVTIWQVKLIIFQNKTKLRNSYNIVTRGLQNVQMNQFHNTISMLSQKGWGGGDIIHKCENICSLP